MKNEDKSKEDLIKELELLYVKCDSLQKDKDRFYALFENIPDGIFISTPEGYYIEVNSFGANLLRYSKEEIVGMHISDVVDYEEQPRVEVELGEARNAPLVNREWKFKRKDNSFFSGIVYSTVLPDDTILGIVQDITQQKDNEILIKQKNEELLLQNIELQHANEESAKNEIRFKSLFQNIGNSLAIYEVIYNESGEPSDYEYVEVNVFYEKSIGMEASYLVGKTLLEVFPETEQIWLDGLKRVVLSSKQETISSYNKQLDRYFEVIVFVPQKGQLALIGSDITKRKIAEKSLQESELRFKALHEATSGGIVIHDKGIILECNHGLAVMTGYSESELIGMDGLLLIAETSREYVMRKIVAGYEKAYEAVGVRKNGEEYPIRLEGRNIPYKGKDVRTVEFRDITEIKKAMEEKFKLQSQLQQSQKMDAIGQLAGGVAHDFNNMLGGIIGASQLLKNPKFNLDTKALHYVNMILEASNRAANLTAKLLAFGRKSHLNTTTIDMNEIIDDTVAFLKQTIDKKIKVTVEKEAQNSIVIGDSSALQNSILNLGINASQAMDNGGELIIKTRNITLKENYCDKSPFNISAGEFIEIEVRDTGCGISTENIGKIFEPFFTTKEQGKGTGLGLASVYGTIQDHYGAINVYSEIGTGSVFHIYLRCCEECLAAYEDEELVVVGSGKILLVDDEEIIRETGKYTLEDMGYSVILANNGEEGVEIYKEQFSQIDLVIMDMIMPEMNGSEAFLKMKEINQHCKVIIASGFTKDENLDNLKKNGLAGFIQKPFRSYELSKLVKKVLTEKH